MGARLGLIVASSLFGVGDGRTDGTNDSVGLLDGRENGAPDSVGCIDGAVDGEGEDAIVGAVVGKFEGANKGTEDDGGAVGRCEAGEDG